MLDSLFTVIADDIMIILTLPGSKYSYLNIDMRKKISDNLHNKLAD